MRKMMQSLLKRFWHCESVISELRNSYSQSIVSLLATNKLDIMHAIMCSTNNVIIIRNPLSDERWRYEYLKPISTNMHVLEYRDRCFESCIIANSVNTIAGN